MLKTDKKLILASASPRRREILEKFNYDFEVIPAVSEEKIEAMLSPKEVVMTLALTKALEVYKLYGRPTLGADTVVVFDGKILGKPKDFDEERCFLKMLSANTHEVYTGYAFLSEKTKVIDFDLSVVEFNALSSELIEEYTLSKNGMDKAGGYGAQDGYGLVKGVSGSLYNVIGLPIEKIKILLDGENL